MKMSTTNKKKNRLRFLLIAAAALGASSATMSGALGALAIQQTVAGQAEVA
jgi:hypothetical protein